MTAERPRDGSSDAVCDGSSDAVSRSVVPAGPILARRSVFRSVSAWLGGNRLGLAVLALIVGAGAGLGAAVFRELIYAFTWLATGYTRFGQQGHAPSLHFPALGIFFVLVIPVVGGLLYGPLIQRFAKEARGHGVPEVMLAVAENGGRIRPQVTIVKALASAICIGTGGSVGREGPIVQIGSAFASTLGQLVRVSENRLRIIVACGAAGGIAATFNAPVTGLFFGFEIVLREFSLDALFATSLAAVTGDVISRVFFGSAPFFTQVPHDLVLANDSAYLLVAVLALAAGLIGVGFKTFLYWLEDFADELLEGPPGMGAAGGRRRRARPGAARAPTDVWGGLSGDGQGARRPVRPMVRRHPDARQGPGVQPDPLDRRLGRGVRPRYSSARCSGWRSAPSRTTCSGPRSARPRCTQWSRWAEFSQPPRRPH